MPESGNKSREVSPSRHQGSLAAPNSAARGRTGRPGLLEPYHDIAATFFSVGKGADLDSLFLTAARDGDYEKIEAFLRRRNESLINIDVRDRVSGNTPLIWAAKRGHGKIVQLLLRHGADITLRNYEGQTAVEVASPAVRTQLLDSVDKGGAHRNLLQAAWQGNAKLVKKILAESRVDINCRNADGLTPLLLVTRDVQLFEKLGSRVAKGYDPNQVVSDLLAYRADPNAEDEEGRTPLHYVSCTKAINSNNIIRMLLKDGSDTESRDRRCFTPIHCASQSGNVDVVVALLDGGSDANVRGCAGTTPLHISAINGHDAVVSKLLERGADVTSVDDSGLTPVDVAKTKKVKATLKQAWSEATQGRAKDNLGPVRCPSSTSRRSFDGSIPASAPKSPKKGGQVIFDTLPSTSASSLDALTPRRAAVSMLQRQLTHVEQTRKAEEKMMRDISSAAPRVRGRTANTTARVTGRRLSPLRNHSPNKTGRREIKFSVGTKPHDGTRTGSAGARRVEPPTPQVTGVRDSQIPVTILGLDLDDNLQEVRVKRIVQGPVGQLLSRKGQFYRSFSSDSAVEPADDLYLRGMSSGRGSMTTLNDEWEDVSLLSSSPPRLTPLRTPSATSERRLQTIDEVRGTHHRPYILDLDQMQLAQMDPSPVLGDNMAYQHPYSQRLLPPTPIYGQNFDSHHDVQVTDMSQYFSGSSKETSPRSDEDSEGEERNITQEESKNDADHGTVQLAITDVQELVRSKSVLFHGNFDIKTTRVHNSDDSGCPEEISGSNRSSFASSIGSNSSPEGDVQRKQDGSKAAKTGDKNIKVPPGSSKGQQDTNVSKKQIELQRRSKSGKQMETKNEMLNKTAQNASMKLQQAARDNATQLHKAKNLQTPAQNSHQIQRPFQNLQQNPSPGNAPQPKDQVTVHSPAWKGKMTDVDSSWHSVTRATNDSQNQRLSETSQSVVSNSSSQAAINSNQGQTKVTAQQEVKSTTSSNQNIQTNTVKASVPTTPSSTTRNLTETPQQSSQSSQKAPNTPSPAKSSDAQSPGKNQKCSERTPVIGMTSSGNSSNEQQKEPPVRPPLPSAANFNKAPETSPVRIPPPRPAAPPRSRTPSASSNSSSGSSSKDAPQRPPLPKKVKTPLSRTTSSPTGSTTGRKAGRPLTSSSSVPLAMSNTKGLKSKTVSETTTFRLSTYLAQKEALMGKEEQSVSSANEGCFLGEQKSCDTSASPAVSPGQPQSTPAIILTSQSQTHFHLTEAQEPRDQKDLNENLQKSAEARVIEQPQVKQIQVKEHMSPVDSTVLAKEKGESPGRKVHLTKFVEATSLEGKPSHDEHNGPVIWDPFEALRAQQKPMDSENVQQKPSNLRMKSARNKTVLKKKATDRQWSTLRGPSGSVAKGKDGKVQENKKGARSRSKSPRPKSPKRAKGRKGKKKGKKDDQSSVKVLLDGKTEMPSNIAFIGGLGWQIKTECNERDDDVKPLKFRPPIYHSSDDDDPMPGPKVLPNYLNEEQTLSDLLLSDRHEENQMKHLLQLPGQTDYGMSDTTDTESDIEEMPDAEEMVDEVVFPLSTSKDDVTPRVINGALSYHPGKLIPSPKTTLYPNPGETYGEENAEIDLEHLETAKDLEDASTTKAPESGQEADEVETEDEFSEEEPPPLLPYDKKGMMHGTTSQTNAILPGPTSAKPKGRSPKATPIVNALAKTPPKATPKATPSATPKATPKATPNTTPKATPATSPKRTTVTEAGKVAGSSNSPQAPPRRSRTGAAAKPIPTKKSPGRLTGEPSKTIEKAKDSSPNREKNGAANDKKVSQTETSQSQEQARTVVEDNKNESDISEEARILPQVPKRRSLKEKREKRDEKEKEVQPSDPENPDEDPEIIAMIDEILKSTPHPSLTLSLKSGKGSADKQNPPKSHEELLRLSINARNKLEAELQNSQNGRIFSEVPVQQTDAHLFHTDHPELEEDPQNRLLQQEQQELQKIMNSLRKVELTVGSDQTLDFQKVRKQEVKQKNKKRDQDSQGSSSPPSSSSKDQQPGSCSVDQTSIKKPPIPPNMSAGSPSSQDTSSLKQLDKSPRFIRKLNSWREDIQKHAVPPGESIKKPMFLRLEVPKDSSRSMPRLVDDYDVVYERWQSLRWETLDSGFCDTFDGADTPTWDSDTMSELSLPCSEMNSDTVSIASGFNELEDSIVPKDGRILTSRLGRRSSASRAVSVMSSAESNADEQIETIQWKRGNMLGQGAYGKVWCGLTNGGELIAVKQIELNINDMEKAESEYEKIQEEVELLKTLKHRNIVGYLGTSLEDNIVSIFMQFVPGGSIANLLARFGALEEEVFCHYTKQILEGVDYLHANNIIHRDIKGGNIMLMHNGIIKLIDFGCAKRLCLNVNALNSSNSNLLKSMRGTPYWMAPEVVKETGYGTKSDIWSIGCTVFEMATRKPPWADVPPMAAIFAIGADRGVPQLPGKFSDTAKIFVSLCMTKDQNLRPSATELLSHPFIIKKKRK